MRTSARAIVLKDDRLLVMDRYKNKQHFLTLVGGGVEAGETAEEALVREVLEESSLVIAEPRLVIEEMAGLKYGRQFIYLCKYVSGQPKLAADAEESHQVSLGRNLYSPIWLKISDLPTARLLPIALRDLLVKLISDGFPDQPLKLVAAEDAKI